MERAVSNFSLVSPALQDEVMAMGKRIAELEGALRELLDHDDARFGFEGEPSEVEKRCRAVLDLHAQRKGSAR